jgi:hypothetical protein
MGKLLRRWRKGIRRGCGRCHHDWFYHITPITHSPKKCDKCNCKTYSIERVVWWKVLFNVYD